MTNTPEQELYAKAWGDDGKPAADGAVQKASLALGGRAYQLHVQEAKAMGETPMTPEAFAKSQK